MSVTLDEVIQEDVLLIKADVEGWEWSAMKGAQKLLRNHHVENLIMEYSPGIHERMQDVTSVLSTITMLQDLIDAEFRIAHIADGDGPLGSIFHQPELPLFQEVTARNLKYDLFDAKRFRDQTMGCPVPEELTHFKQWSCQAVPEDLNPRSFRCMFGQNTNIWASKNRTLQKLNGTVGLLGLDDPHSVYFIENKWHLASGMRDCRDMEAMYQVRHRCRCTHPEVCAEEERIVQRLAEGGKIESNYHLL